MKRFTVRTCLVVALLIWAIPGLDVQAAEDGKHDGRMAVSALRRLNEYRQRLGLHALRLDPELCIGCKAHAQYLVYNEMPGLSAHHENPGTRGYSLMGNDAASHSVIHYGRPGIPAVESLIGTFYHRLHLLETQGRRLGYGDSPTATLMRVEADSGAGDGILPQQTLGEFLTTDQMTAVDGADQAEWLAFPYEGQQNVPLDFSGEIPNPIPPEDKDQYTGYPITLTYLPGEGIQLQTATLTDQGGREVPVWVVGLGPMGTASSVCLLAKDSLKAGTTYTVHVEVVQGRRHVERTWHFATIAAR